MPCFSLSFASALVKFHEKEKLMKKNKTSGGRTSSTPELHFNWIIQWDGLPDTYTAVNLENNWDQGEEVSCFFMLENKII